MSPGLDGRGVAAMPPDAQTKAGSIGGIGVVEEGVAVRALPKAKAQVPEVVEAAAPMEVDGEEGAATSAGGLEPACPPVPMLCSIFSSQVWRAAGWSPGPLARVAWSTRRKSGRWPRSV